MAEADGSRVTDLAAEVVEILKGKGKMCFQVSNDSSVGPVFAVVKCFNSASYPQTFVQFLLFDDLGCVGDVLLNSRGLQPLHGPVRPITRQRIKQSRRGQME